MALQKFLSTLVHQLCNNLSFNNVLSLNDTILEPIDYASGFMRLLSGEVRS